MTDENIGPVVRVSEDFTVEELIRPSRRFAVELVSEEDAATTLATMRDAARAVATVRHPEEPGERFANFVSAVYETDTGAWFFADAKDLDAYPAEAAALLAAVIDATSRSELHDAVLGWTDREAPSPPQPMPEETPVSLPPDFPLPAGARISRTKLVATQGSWRRAEWQLRGDGSPADVATAYYRSLQTSGWAVSEYRTGTARQGVTLWYGWSMTSPDAEADVNVGGVDRAAMVPAERVDRDDPEWSRRFVTGGAWSAYIEVRPGASGWQPHAHLPE